MEEKPGWEIIGPLLCPNPPFLKSPSKSLNKKTFNDNLILDYCSSDSSSVGDRPRGGGRCEVISNLAESSELSQKAGKDEERPSGFVPVFMWL